MLDTLGELHMSAAVEDLVGHFKPSGEHDILLSNAVRPERRPQRDKLRG
jgi:hypothetical protein